jgi:hypothetical protein
VQGYHRVLTLPGGALTPPEASADIRGA